MKPVRAEVVSEQQLAADVFSVWLRAPTIARQVKPGQFLNVRIGYGPDPLLRRPISVADAKGSRVRLVFRVVGRGTSLLSRVRAGQSLDVLGPLGRPAPTPRNRTVVVCGGGVGVAPLLLLVSRLRRQNQVRVLLGARTRRELVLRREFRDLGVSMELATDDGSLGYCGPVTDIAVRTVRQEANPVVFACGPKPMLRDLVARVQPVEVLGFVEERMGCGTGICYCCALPKRDGGYVRFCKDGPVVKLNEVVL